MLIAFEGIDGSGKGTQSRLLADRLHKDGFGVRFESFPDYKSTSGFRIKRYLEGEFGQIDPFLAASLYALNRAGRAQAIRESLSDGWFVVCDRYVASNLAHQSARSSHPEDLRAEIARLEYLELRLPKPDMTIWLDLSTHESRTRAAKRGRPDMHEADLGHLEKTRRAYVDLHEEDPTWVRVNAAAGTPEQIADTIYAEVRRVCGEFMGQAG